ncbi:MAG TPA: polyprenyl synthetase family protein [Desulfitobacteriaceae bacterium]|nr:polyprenyl synthetase family protein [Desulfitobacteriaceae bacterium]
MQVLKPVDEYLPGLPSLKTNEKTQFSELLLVESKLQEVLGKAEGIIKSTCLSLLNSGGKRIRPLLTITSGMCFNRLNNNMIDAAVASELIHMASLIHDDIIDNSATRRNRPTVNSLLGNNAAVLTGDFIFAEAFNILATGQLLPCMNFLVKAIKEMCDGEVNQAAEQFNPAVTSHNYFSRIAKKTGILLAACCKSGAVAGGAREEEIYVMGEYGLNLGYAFQIIDDILDFTGSEHITGKPVGVDITSGNITLPIILLMEEPLYADWLKNLLQTRHVTASDLDNICKALHRTNSLTKAYKVAGQCIDKAKSYLNSVPDSGYKTGLLDLADQIRIRQS